MAVTKILARRARLDALVSYVLNGDKTEDKILTAYCDVTEQNPYRAMRATKENAGKTGGVQGYHIIQSFAPGEIEPEQALEIAQKFCEEHLRGYEAVIGVHTDRRHIHAHIAFNSVHKYTHKKYHSNAQTYYGQIRDISDRLCKEYGLSIVMRAEATKAETAPKALTYAEWLRQQRGQPTWAGMLNADLRLAIGQAAGYGHFLMLMENMGYEIKHGKHLAFRLRGTENFIRPGRKDAGFTEDGIRAAINGQLTFDSGQLNDVPTNRVAYTPFRPKQKLSGFLALYAHYLYLLGKTHRQEYPPKMTPRLKRELMKFDRYRAQFRFLRENGIESELQLAAHVTQAETKLASLTKRRVILNAQKKKRKPLYDALATEHALLPAKALYATGFAGAEEEFAMYMDAAALLNACGLPREQVTQEKTKIYQDIADINAEIRAARREISLCEVIRERAPRMEKDIASAIPQKKKEVTKDHGNRR